MALFTAVLDNFSPKNRFCVITVINRNISYTKTLDRKKRDFFFILWYENKYEEMYHYFRENGERLINLVIQTETKT